VFVLIDLWHLKVLSEFSVDLDRSDLIVLIQDTKSGIVGVARRWCLEWDDR
jgi:hypothetical protein